MRLAVIAYSIRRLFGGRRRTSKRLATVGKLPKLEAQAEAAYPDYTSWAERVQAEAERTAE